MRLGLRGLLRELRPPRTPGVLAPEYGPGVAIEMSVAALSEAALRAEGARRPR
ncbi:MAG: hypothetical protein GSR80_000990 [Desulfurococcales archaeon]|nr:hypothetical protein [Desulfurococcales archaeon]